MASTTDIPVLRYIHKLAATSATRRMTDVELLQRFSTEQDEDAFAELMRRHGPLVLSVCRRVLGHEQDAEDSFQAAFLVLARKARAIRKGESVGSFLYGVAYRIAMKERTKRAGRRQREQWAEQPALTWPVDEAVWRELQVILDEGLNRLPEKYRAPFVLCCLERKSKSEAARELNWKEGTVSSRLAHARKELQQFLSRKGVTRSATLAGVGIAENTASAYVPPVLAASCVRAAALFASGSTAALETAKAVRLAEMLLQSMAALPWKTATALVMAACLAAGGAGLGHHAEATKRAAASESPKARPSAPRKQAQSSEKPRTDRYGDPLPEGALARFGTIRFRKGFFTHAVLFSPDGKIIACAAGRGVYLWDAATGKELRQISRWTPSRSIAFSPDGKTLACVFNNFKETGLYETATGRKVADLPGNVLGQLAYSPDGKILAVASGPGRVIHLLDASTGEKQKQEITSAQGEIHRLAWSPDSKKLAWVGTNGSIHLCYADKGDEIDRWKGHEKNIFDVAFSPDGKTLATASADATICLWDVTTRKKTYTLDGKHQQVRTIAFSHDGRMLATGHGDGTIAVWDAAKGEEIRRWQAHVFEIESLAFAPDDKTLVSGASLECRLRLWSVATGEEVRPFAGHAAIVDHLKFSEDGKGIISMGRDKILDWDLASGRDRVRSRLAHGIYDQRAFSPRGDVAASWGYYDDTIRLWDTATGKNRRTLGKFNASKKGFTGGLEFSPDGRLLAGATDHQVRLWDVNTGRQRQALKGFEGQIRCIQFSADGKRLAAVAGGQGIASMIGMWDVFSGERWGEFIRAERVHSLTFSPDGKTLASGSSRGGPRLWDATTGHELRRLAGPAVAGLAFSPDGKWLAGAGADEDQDEDQKVHVWEVNTGLEVRAFQGHVGLVLSVVFAPDGRTLASVGFDSTVLLWDFTGRMRNGQLQTANWTQQGLEQRWKDLASRDGKRPVQAIWDLAASPEQAVPMLRQRIKPAQPADAKRVERLVRDLDSEVFEARTKATEELEKIIDQAEPALRKRLVDKPSLEMRRRIEEVLAKRERSVERLRALRAIQVLEYAGTAEAREHLRALTKGVAEAQLTCEAKAALLRLTN